LTGWIFVWREFFTDTCVQRKRKLEALQDSLKSEEQKATQLAKALATAKQLRPLTVRGFFLYIDHVDEEDSLTCAGGASRDPHAAQGRARKEGAVREGAAGVCLV
jgi:predicted RNase H-like nuclease (RuvC/YqgF family)